jgi:hypothetical protein
MYDSFLNCLKGLDGLVIFLPIVHAGITLEKHHERLGQKNIETW